MKNRFQHLVRARLFGAVLTVIWLSTGCASARDGFMSHLLRGQVIVASGREVSVRLGEKDRIHLGQRLEVFRLVQRHAPGQRRLLFRQVKTGEIQIAAFLGEHLAQATVVSGQVRRGYFAGPQPQ